MELNKREKAILIYINSMTIIMAFLFISCYSKLNQNNNSLKKENKVKQEVTNAYIIK